MFQLYSYKLRREGLILRSDRGWGEISPLPGFSPETLPEALSEILLFLRTGAEPKLPSVQFGLACARQPFSLAPIKIPLCSLGPKEGFSAAKLKVGLLSLSDAIALAKTHLKKCRLRIDANRAWSLNQALEFASHFKPDDFEYLEEPVNSFPDLIRFSEATGFPIAADESFRDSDWRKIPTLKAAVVKPSLIGYVPQVKSPIKRVFSSSFETGIGLLHIARLWKEGELPIGLDTLFPIDLLRDPIKAEKGCFSWTPESETFIDMAKLCPIVL